MKKIAVVLALMVFLLAVFGPFNFSTEFAQAQTTGYSIQTVTHEVRVLHSGLIIISDTIQITGTTPNLIQVGFPFQYASSVIDVEAYDSNNVALSVTKDVSLQGQSGFYGTTVYLDDATSTTFTVIFILSNDLLSAISIGYILNYPAYPSLTTKAATVNTTLVFPSDVVLSEIEKEDGALNQTSYSKNNLEAFTSMMANATISTTTEKIGLISIPSLDRIITIDPSGNVKCTDKYVLINNGEKTQSSFKLNLPVIATGISASDQFGRALTLTSYDTGTTIKTANITFIQTLSAG
ncbi:MAG: hypothetical protein GX638_10435, partial [Crenarchaeota archaeon]|nr:hypothetical protein [Thermoproteota archaeon]